MATGNQKSKKWAIVINAKKETPSTDIKPELEAVLFNLTNNSTNKLYFAIIHDKDFTENGEPKRAHLHIVYEYHEKKTFSAVLSDLVNSAKLEADQISLEASNSEFLAEQYLIHKNDTSKYSYNAEQIITNDRAELEKRLNAEYLTEQEREARNLDALKTAKSFNELLDKVGLNFANKYRAVFNELRAERNQNVEGLQKQLDRVSHNYDLLIRALKDFSVDIELKALTHKEIIERVNKLIFDFDESNK